MMAHTTLALHPLAFLPAAEPKLAISFSDVIHPAMCLGPWHLQWFADSKTGSQPWKPGWKQRGGSKYQHSARTPASSELIREACTGVFHLDQGSYRMPPAWSSLPFICRSGQGRTRVFPNSVTSHCTLDISTRMDNLVAGIHWDVYYPISFPKSRKALLDADVIRLLTDQNIRIQN